MHHEVRIQKLSTGINLLPGSTVQMTAHNLTAAVLYATVNNHRTINIFSSLLYNRPLGGTCSHNKTNKFKITRLKRLPNTQLQLANWASAQKEHTP